MSHTLPLTETVLTRERIQEMRGLYGLYISFENFAPFTDDGRRVYLKRWKSYQIESGKSMQESEEHIARYGKEYYPVSVTENLKLMRECGFKTVEILWLSNMQIGIWGIK